MSSVFFDDLTTHLATRSDVGREDLETLTQKFYPELRRMARRLMSGERKDHTLSGTALVHETFLRLLRTGSADWNEPGHFLLTAAKVMKHVLTDHSRRKLAAKRNEPKSSDLSNNLSYSAEDIAAVGQLVDRLEAADPRAANVFTLRFYAGMTNEEVAQALGMSPKTTSQDWRWARAWLRAAVNGAIGSPKKAG